MQSGKTMVVHDASSDGRRGRERKHVDIAVALLRRRGREVQGVHLPSLGRYANGKGVDV